MNLKVHAGVKQVDDGWTVGVTNDAVTTTGDNHWSYKSNVGTSEETVTFGGDVTPGYCVIRNRDATNYVEVGTATGVYWGKLLGGQSMCVRLNGASALYLRANTAACDVEVWVFDA